MSNQALSHRSRKFCHAQLLSVNLITICISPPIYNQPVAMAMGNSYLLYGSKEEDMGRKGKGNNIRLSFALLYIIPFPIPAYFLLLVTV